MKASHLIAAFSALSITLSGACIGPQHPEMGRLGENGRMASVNTLRSTAHVLAVQGRDSQCKIVLEKLIADHPYEMSSYNEMAELYLRNDRIDYALEILHIGLDKSPEETVLMNNVGMCHVLRKDYSTALEWFQRAAATDATDARSTANVAFALGMLGRYDEALRTYLTVMPRDQAHHNVGILCEATGDHARASAAFEYAEILNGLANG